MKAEETFANSIVTPTRMPENDKGIVGEWIDMNNFYPSNNILLSYLQL